METFTVCTRQSLFINMLCIVAVGALPWIVLVNRGGGPVLFIFCGVTVVGLIAVLRRIHTIRVGTDGTIRFERLLGTTCISLHEISVLEGFRKNEYDGMVWKMRVRYGRGTLTVPFFDEAPAFISMVRAVEPGIYVQGEWPLLDPFGDHAISGKTGLS
ncbi:MAG TPA: hypothetical protein VEW66_07750 [Thermomicrobiales bacterium]|nr:hypothetical protein [Thermomicrobiales bacterium]